MSSPGHLLRRWVLALPTAPPPPADEAWVDQWLLPGERALWTRLVNHDRRHAIAVARRFRAARPGAPRDEMAAALLHDVGKLQSGLGVHGRVVATVVGPRGERFRSYHDHEAVGAALLAEVGSSDSTIAMVRGEGPAAAALRRADDC
jgi:hypothetical protein